MCCLVCFPFGVLPCCVVAAICKPSQFGVLAISGPMGLPAHTPNGRDLGLHNSASDCLRLARYPVLLFSLHQWTASLNLKPKSLGQLYRLQVLKQMVAKIRTYCTGGRSTAGIHSTWWARRLNPCEATPWLFSRLYVDFQYWRSRDLGGWARQCC